MNSFLLCEYFCEIIIKLHGKAILYNYTEYLLKEDFGPNSNLFCLGAIAYLGTRSSLINCVCKNQKMP